MIHNDDTDAQRKALHNKLQAALDAQPALIAAHDQATNAARAIIAGDLARITRQLVELSAMPEISTDKLYALAGATLDAGYLLDDLERDLGSAERALVSNRDAVRVLKDSLALLGAGRTN